MSKYRYTKFSAGPQPFRLDDPHIETTDFEEAITYLQQRKAGTITAKVVVPIDTEVFAILTNEDVAGKTLAQILEMFESKIDRVIAMILTLPKAFLSLLKLDR